jgi:ABC-type multidrug transport system fused ATPase/permease subunit
MPYSLVSPFSLMTSLDLILNYRTVIAFGDQNINRIMHNYEQLLTGTAKKRIRNAHLAGLAFGYSVCIRFIYIGVIFYIGATFIKKFELNSQDVYTGINILFMSALGAGFAMSQMPSATQARDSAAKVFAIVDEQSSLDTRDKKQRKQIEKGEIKFEEVTFNYPTRKHRVLSKFNLHIPAGMKIGLVGHSGCGKSTITNLILRYYNLRKG